MTESVWWYLLAGFLVGFILSTMWEWLYFRRRRLNIENRRIAELESTIRSLTAAGTVAGTLSSPTSASGYQGPGVFLENEQVHTESAVTQKTVEIEPPYPPGTESANVTDEPVPAVAVIPLPPRQREGRNGFVRAAAPAAVAASTAAVVAAEREHNKAMEAAPEQAAAVTTTGVPAEAAASAAVAAAALAAAEQELGAGAGEQTTQPELLPGSDDQASAAALTAASATTDATAFTELTKNEQTDTDQRPAPVAGAAAGTATDTATASTGASAVPESRSLFARAVGAAAAAVLAAEHKLKKEPATPAEEQPAAESLFATPKEALPETIASEDAQPLQPVETRDEVETSAEIERPEAALPASENHNGILNVAAPAAAIAAAVHASEAQQDGGLLAPEQSAAKPPLSSFLPSAVNGTTNYSNGSQAPGAGAATHAIPAEGIQPGIQRVSGELDDLVVSLQGLIETTDPLLESTGDAGAVGTSDSPPAESLSRSEQAVVRLMQSARRFGRDLRSIWQQ